MRFFEWWLGNDEPKQPFRLGLIFMLVSPFALLFEMPLIAGICMIAAILFSLPLAFAPSLPVEIPVEVEKHIYHSAGLHEVARVYYELSQRLSELGASGYKFEEVLPVKHSPKYRVYAVIDGDYYHIGTLVNAKKLQLILEKVHVVGGKKQNDSGPSLRVNGNRYDVKEVMRILEQQHSDYPSFD